MSIHNKSSSIAAPSYHSFKNKNLLFISEEWFTIPSFSTAIKYTPTWSHFQNITQAENLHEAIYYRWCLKNIEESRNQACSFILSKEHLQDSSLLRPIQVCIQPFIPPISLRKQRWTVEVWRETSYATTIKYSAQYNKEQGCYTCAKCEPATLK
jgi:hypothetical protein